MNQRVLLVDLDPQGNATMGAGINKAELQSSIYEVLLGMADVATARVRSETGSLMSCPQIVNWRVQKWKWLSSTIAKSA
mgnify:CR=1 FL=1